jgi:hypothetical protein
MRTSAVLSSLRAVVATPRRLIVFLFGLLVLAGGSSLAYAAVTDSGPQRAASTVDPSIEYSNRP